MKTKKALLTIVTICSLLALFAVSAHAANTWYTCTVVQTGPGWGTTYVRLSDDGGAFTNKWFSVKDEQAKEQLATALTAKTNGDKVWMNTDISGGQYPRINAIYLGGPPTE